MHARYSLLRRHPSPSRERFEPLIAAAASRGEPSLAFLSHVLLAFRPSSAHGLSSSSSTSLPSHAAGFTLNVDDSRALQRSLDASVDPNDPYVNKIIRIMATRCVRFCVFGFVFMWVRWLGSERADVSWCGGRPSPPPSRAPAR